MLDAITFDLWDTLIRETPESARKVTEARIRGLYMLLQSQGYAGTVEEVGAAYDEVGERLGGIWSRNEDVGAEGQVKLFLEALDHGCELSPDPMALANMEWAYVSPALQALPVLNQGAAELMAEMGKRYRLGLICNTGRTPGTMLKIILQRLGILEHFDVLTFSDVVGLRKPDPQIFQVTLDGLSVPANRALHVGDNPSTDIQGARRMGMRAVLLGSPEAAPPDDGGVWTIEALGELPRILEQLERQGGKAGVQS
ncbi:MAG: HAD family hydrolase [Candidatus Methylomirabilales bacterium]